MTSNDDENDGAISDRWCFRPDFNTNNKGAVRKLANEITDWVLSAREKVQNKMKRDQAQGLYQKYDITRTDGSSEPGQRHENCRYFVLDLTHDPNSKPALEAYIAACRDEFPRLAEDLTLLLTKDQDGK